MKTKSALSFYGSDSGVAAAIGRLFGGCRHVTIPFIGGASVLPHLTARAIVGNDLHANAINFYRVVSGVYGKAAAEGRCGARSGFLSRKLGTAAGPDYRNFELRSET